MLLCMYANEVGDFSFQECKLEYILKYMPKATNPLSTGGF